MKRTKKNHLFILITCVKIQSLLNIQCISIMFIHFCVVVMDDWHELIEFYGKIMNNLIATMITYELI